MKSLSKVFVTFVFVGFMAGFAEAQAPEMFRYQGRLVDDANLVNATLPISFKLYDALSDGALLYEDSNDVLVVDGLYSTMIGDDTILGSLTNALTNTAVYLELTVDGETLSPRERLVSVPYAMTASEVTHVHDRIMYLGDALTGMDFGKVYEGYSRSLYLYIRNDGDAGLAIADIEYSDPRFSGSFAGTVYPWDRAGKSVMITFSPELTQSYSGTATVNSDKSGGTNVFSCVGICVPPRYVDNEDGTVTDLATGLMWTKNANHGEMGWSAAIAYCDSLVTNGYSDWRLPSVDREGDTAELDTLFREDGSPSGAWEMSSGHPFDNVQGHYWSSTPLNSNQSWLMRMSDGYLFNTYRNAHDVWPVRGGQ